MILFAGSVKGQHVNSNLHTAHIYITKDTLIKVENTISTSSITIKSNAGLNYETLLNNNMLKVVYQGVNDSITLSFRELSFNVASGNSAIDSMDISTDERVIPIETDYRKMILNDRLFIQSNKLEYKGSFSRGVSFGNSQDLVLNSNFDLQIRGDLGNGLFLRAAISDDNIPIQPEGNTQVLQEFDKVFIEVQKDKTTVVAGDYELSRPDSYFVNYYKKLKGLSVTNEQALGGSWTISNRGSFAVSRGKFRRQTLEVQEGNQGPYKLIGTDGELFLQVLSGTEKVFADGQLLKRGENGDYVIDYNRGELRFTPNLIITANSRIIVEFEYAVQSYLRSLYATETSIVGNRWAFGINFYNEVDSKSLSSNIELDTSDLRLLREGGNEKIFRDGRFTIPDNSTENLVLYRDSLGILIYEQDNMNASTGAVFSNFGPNNGEYTIDTNAGANGRVYKYVGEKNGILQGNYSPKIPLVAPEKKQITSFSAKYNFRDSSSVYFESALSNNDPNRFSNIGNNLNTGLSFYTKIEDKRAFGQKSKFALETTIEKEFAQKNFRALNPYRTAEFQRDWNLDTGFNKNDQDFLNAEIKLKKEKSSLFYNFSRFSDKDLYAGNKHRTGFEMHIKTWHLNLIGNWLNSENLNLNESIYFFRPKGGISKSFFNDKWTIGAQFEKEENIRKFITQDSLNAISANYELSKVFLENRTSENVSFNFGISKRNDDRVVDNTLSPVTKSVSFELGGNWLLQKSSNLTWRFVLRDYKVDSIYLAQDKSKKSLIGTIDHKLSLFNKGLSLSTFYESNSGQEPKIEFQFVKVQNGEGSYVWNDFSEDGLQQIVEFELAPFSDQASYEKISVFNNEFLSTNRNILNQILKIDPKNFIGNKSSLLSKFQLNSRYHIDQKSLSDGNRSLFKFINFNLDSPDLVSFSSSVDNSLFFNRGNPKYDLQFSHRLVSNKILQISGFDQRRNLTFYTRSRINIEKQFDAIVETNIGRKNRVAENFITYNFNIDYWSVIPQVNYRPTSKLRAILKYRFEKNTNIDTLGFQAEKALVHDGGLDLTWRQNQTSNLQLKFNYVLISFDGKSNSPIEFELLQGLKNGKNLIWDLNYTRRISSSIEMIIHYNGRKSQESRMVNTAGVQMRAIF